MKNSTENHEELGKFIENENHSPASRKDVCLSEIQSALNSLAKKNTNKASEIRNELLSIGANVMLLGLEYGENLNRLSITDSFLIGLNEEARLLLFLSNLCLLSNTIVE